MRGLEGWQRTRCGHPSGLALKEGLSRFPYAASAGLFVSDTTAALSGKFTWPDFNPWFWDGAYALGIRPAS